jgi:hypothetical protein
MRRGLALWALVLGLFVVAAPGAAAAAALTWQPGAHLPGVFDVVGPRSDGRLVVAATGGLYLLDAAGRTTRFAPSYSPPSGPESYIAISPGLSDDNGSCVFARDAVAALDLTTSPPGITLITPTGGLSHLANISGVSGLFGITFDTTGQFGHRILVVGSIAGGGTQISAVDCLGHVSTIGIVNVPLEGGIAVAPSTFGTFAGQLIAPNELDGSIYAVSPAGSLSTVAKSGLPFGQDIGVESLGFVPASGPGVAYMSDRATAGSQHPGNDRVLLLSGSALVSAGIQPGELLAGTEGGATVVGVRCVAVCSVATIVAVPTTAHGEGSLTVLPRSAPGYWLAGSDGGVFSFGSAGFFGSIAGTRLNAPIVAVAGAPEGGYWLAGSDGGVFSFGSAGFFGSIAGTRLNAPIVGIASTRDGTGYYLVASDGGVFAFGDATFEGSMGGTRLNKPVVGMDVTPDNRGYYLVASDGGVFAFGDARFEGSMGGAPLNKPVVGMAVDVGPSSGYWLVAGDGGVFSFGAPFLGSTGSLHLVAPVVGMAATADGLGYYLVAGDGGVFAFSDAEFFGSMGGTHLNAPVVGIASTG